MFCKYCGKEIEENSTVCSHCGNQLIDATNNSEVQLATVPNEYESSNQTVFGGVNTTEGVKTTPLQTQKKEKKKTNWVWQIIEYIIIAIVIIIGYGMYKDYQFVNYVKDIKNKEISDKTYGEAFSDFSINPEWKLEERDGDKGSVSVRGGCTLDGEDSEYKIYFDVEEIDGDQYTVQADKLYLNEEKQNDLIMSLFLMRILEEDDKGGEEADGEQAEEQSQVFENEGDLSGSHILVQDCTVGYEDDEPVAVITYQFTNGSGSQAGFEELFSTFVSQNGVELDDDWSFEDDGYFDSTKIEDGVEYTYQEKYKLRDTESDIKVSVEAHWDFSDAKDRVEKVFALTSDEQEQDETEQKEKKKDKTKTDKESVKIAEPEFSGTWYDVYSQRCHMEIAKLNDVYYDITIDWGGSAWDNAHWELQGEYDADKGCIVYTGSYIEQHYSDDGECTDTVIYDDGTGEISMKDGVLYWDDQKANAGENCVFERGLTE